MNELIAALIILCYSFATGIFYVPSCLEKPVWSLMRNPDSEKAAKVGILGLQTQRYSIL